MVRSNITFLLVLVSIFCGSRVLSAQSTEYPIAQRVAEKAAAFDQLPATPLMTPLAVQNKSLYQVEDEVEQAVFLDVSATQVTLLQGLRPQYLRLQLPAIAGKPLELVLYQADVFTETFQVTAASQPDQAYPYEGGLHYWGIVEGDETSLAAISVSEDEVAGFVIVQNERYTLGRINEANHTDVHVLYRDSDLKIDLPVGCDTDDDAHYVGSDKPDGVAINTQKDANNCVRMYIEVDHDIFIGKGGVTQAANYVSGAFSQVAIMYANENINLTVNEILVWNVTDPYTGPSTGNYLNQFRTHLNGNFNGDLAHLVGYNGGGGIAYLDVLCNNNWGVAYSDIGASYANVPNYSWTIMVLTHEIGHNLGSPHTHACAWNGNNTAIDGCGFQAGSGGCNGPIPPSGTIMSYCHLIGGVGINFNLGFGTQPGNLIRNQVYSAPCLTSCSVGQITDVGIGNVSQPTGAVCGSSLAPVVVLENFGTENIISTTINYSIDGVFAGSYLWTGNLAPATTTSVTLPAIALTPGNHTFSAQTTNPNGTTDANGSNNTGSSAYSFTDSDNDGVCNSQDICPNGDDNLDSDNDGIPDACDCTGGTANFPDNPLTHTGSGSSSTSYLFGDGISNVTFTVSAINAITFGRPSDRFDEQVTITYVNGNGNVITYGTVSGSSVGSYDVAIIGSVQSVTVSLADGYDGNTNQLLSVNLSPIEHCGFDTGGCNDSDNDGICDNVDVCPGFDDGLIGTPCNDGDPCTTDDTYTVNCNCVGTYADSDNDGVCDANDICPGGDDTVDTDGDGIPDACDTADCTNTISVAFSPDPLTHSGTGNSTAQAAPTVNVENVTFTVFNMNSQLNGRQDQLFDEQVTITYVDGSGTVQTYGTFFGSVQNTVDVSISGIVQSVTISLADGYDGNANNLSVNSTDLTGCQSGAAPEGLLTETATDIRLFPNPTQDYAVLSFGTTPQRAQVTVRDLLGRVVGRYTVQDQPLLRLAVADWPQSNQVYLITVELPEQDPITRRLIVTK